MSFNIDTEGLLTMASTMFNALWPIFAVIVGLSLGFGLVKYIAKEVSSVF